MIQDIAPHHYSVEYHPSAPVSESIVFFFSGGSLYLHSDDSFFRWNELTDFVNEDMVRFLFTIDDVSYFSFRTNDLSGIENKDKASAWNVFLTNSKKLPVSKLRNLADDVHVFAAYTAYHLDNWYKSNVFCGCCGAPTIDGTAERKVVCSKCGTPVYPRINPAVIAAVHDGDRLLMTRYAARSVTWLVLVAGFTEIGETAEETVAREVLEETGIHVKNIRYFGSQPWGVPGNLTLGYTAELDGSDEITVDTSELSEVVWVDRKDIGEAREHFSITQEMIQAFRRGEF